MNENLLYIELSLPDRFILTKRCVKGCCCCSWPPPTLPTLAADMHVGCDKAEQKQHQQGDDCESDVQSDVEGFSVRVRFGAGAGHGYLSPFRK